MLETLNLAQTGKRSQCLLGRRSIQRIEQSIAAFPQDMLINRLMKFNQNVNLLFGRSLAVHNSRFLPKGGFAQGQDRPQFCLKLSLI
jgi:hypothetical protein